jgi:3-oxoacyl-[acyl-carrier protein] reductase
VALVTGAGRGIGRAVALRLAAGGYRTAVNYRTDRAAAAAVAGEARSAGAADAAVFRADVTDEPQARELVAAVLARWARLDVLVNNVGPLLAASASDTPPAAFRAMLDGNLTSAYLVTAAALPALRERAGRVVMLGSLNAELARGASDHAAYNAAKTALVVWTRSLARSEGRHGLRVNMVSPGIIDTGQLDAAQQAAYAQRVPLGRLGRPEEVAEAVAFLASERSAYISGAVLTVAGGLWV